LSPAARALPPRRRPVFHHLPQAGPLALSVGSWQPAAAPEKGAEAQPALPGLQFPARRTGSGGWCGLPGPAGPVALESPAGACGFDFTAPSAAERRWEMCQMPGRNRQIDYLVPPQPVAEPAQRLLEEQPAEEEGAEYRAPAVLQPAPGRRGLAKRWRNARPPVRRLVLVAPLAALAAISIPWLVQSLPGKGLLDRAQATVRARATIELEDDFRNGLSRWNGGEDGMKGWEYDPAGFLRPGRRLALFRDSLALVDYRLEFLGQIEQKGLNWVFRASDGNNYYRSGIVIVKPGPLPVAAITRCAVVDGREVARAQLPLPLTIRTDMMSRVTVEVRGSQFTTFVNGQLVDTWNDTRLSAGGVGFFCENGGKARLRWVRIVDRDDWLGKLCSYVSSGK